MSVTGVETSSDQLPWRVRYTWKVVRGLPHPRYTYEERPDESRAIDCAVSMVDRNDDRASVFVVCAHVQAPGSDEWRLIDYNRDA